MVVTALSAEISKHSDSVYDSLTAKRAALALYNHTIETALLSQQLPLNTDYEGTGRDAFYAQWLSASKITGINNIHFVHTFSIRYHT